MRFRLGQRQWWQLCTLLKSTQSLPSRLTVWNSWRKTCEQTTRSCFWPRYFCHLFWSHFGSKQSSLFALSLSAGCLVSASRMGSHSSNALSFLDVMQTWFFLWLEGGRKLGWAVAIVFSAGDNYRVTRDCSLLLLVTCWQDRWPP